MKNLRLLQKGILVFFSLAILINFTNPVSAKEVVWHEVEVQETRKEKSQKEEHKKEEVKKEKTKQTSETDKLIAEFLRKQEEDNKLFTRLIANKEQEETKKAEAQKEEISKKLLSQEKQNQETSEKLTAALNELDELKRQYAEQQNKQNLYILEILEELKKTQEGQQNLAQALREQKTEQVINQPQNDDINIYSDAMSKVVVINNQDQYQEKKTIQEYISDSTQDGTKAFSNEADIIFSYSPGALYRVYCSEGFLTDIQLQPGEEIQYIGGGDTTRWIIDQAQSGSGSESRWHIYIKPIREGLKTNIVVTTNRRSYQIQAQSTNWYNPIVRWTYPDEIRKAFQLQEQRNNDSINFSTTSTDNLNFEYKISKKSYNWSPKAVFDDGVKTYIKMPDGMFTGEAPVLFVKDSNGVLAMVNYRLKNGCYIVDRLFKEAELRNGKEIVTIKRR